jgi:hypothetical protein
MPLNPGDTLLNEHYRILGQLGRGGFGFVYQAQDRLLGEEVAIKELIPSLVGDETVLKRFLTEAKATMHLAHDHIVRTHNIFSERGNYYIVMELMAGGSLEALLRQRGALPVGEAVRVAAEVCDGLQYAHGRGVVHCDLKPANILFDAQGRTKVADFGIAHVSGEMRTRTFLTPTGFAAGTLPYMSPEQADGVRGDARVDIYALGAVLYVMLTGRTYLDFDRRDTPGATADNVQRIRHQKPSPPSSHNSRVPAWLDAVVVRALAKRPEDRYRDATAVKAALLRPRKEGKPGARPPLPVWFWALAGGAGVLVVVLAILVWMVFRTEDREIVVAAATASGTHVVATTATSASPATVEAPPTAAATATWSSEPSPMPTQIPIPTSTWTPTLVPEDASGAQAAPAPKPTKTEPAAVFRDDFTGRSLDGAKWSHDAGNGEIVMGNGVVRMRSSGRRYPYIYSRANPFASQGDFRLTARFRYVWVRDCGVGVIMTSCQIPPGVSQQEAERIQQECEAQGVTAGAWQDRAAGLQLWFRSGADRADIAIPGNRTQWNEMTIEYADGKYTLLLNGSPAYTSSPTPHLPQSIWMGHPAELGGDCWWDTLEVDYVEVAGAE